MTSEDYLTWDPHFGDCMLRITDGFPWTDTYMFSIPFLQAYYAIHDLDTHRIGLVRMNRTNEKKVPYNILNNLKKMSDQPGF